jgi:hypothetical protein
LENVQGVAADLGKYTVIEKIAQNSSNNQILLIFTKFGSHGYRLAFSSKKAPFTSTTASNLVLKPRQALATVSLSRLPNTSLIFTTREVTLV